MTEKSSTDKKPTTPDDLMHELKDSVSAEEAAAAYKAREVEGRKEMLAVCQDAQGKVDGAIAAYKEGYEGLTEKQKGLKTLHQQFQSEDHSPEGKKASDDLEKQLEAKRQSVDESRKKFFESEEAWLKHDFELAKAREALEELEMRKEYLEKRFSALEELRPQVEKSIGKARLSFILSEIKKVKGEVDEKLTTPDKFEIELHSAFGEFVKSTKAAQKAGFDRESTKQKLDKEKAELHDQEQNGRQKAFDDLPVENNK